MTKNSDISHLLYEMADLSELANDNPFRIRAYRKAAESIDSLTTDVTTIERKEMLEIPGIGKGVADIIEEFRDKKSVKEHANLLKKFPSGVLQVMSVAGLGPKRAAYLYHEKKIDSLDKLSKAAQKGELAKLKGFGDQLQKNILKNINTVEEGSKRLPVIDARRLGYALIDSLKKAPFIKEIELAGSARRWKETVGDLDIVCTSSSPEKAISMFIETVSSKDILAKGKTKASVVLTNGFQVDFRVVEPESYGAALLYFTGSKDHNVHLREIAQQKGWVLNEYGIFKKSDKNQNNPLAGKTEESMYQKLGLPWIPPELREDRGEIAAALDNKLPTLVELKDINGDFHNHTNMSDGAHTLEQMISAAEKRKWEWFYSADHSSSLTVANGLSIDRLTKKMEELNRLKKSHKNISLFCSSEVDILKDGELDYPDEILKKLDCVVASVHSRFSMSESEMTERICKALKNPYTDILGHLSGRLIGRRDSYAINIERILDTAAETQTAIEINGQSDRAELRDIDVRTAIKKKVPLAVNTDAHTMEQLGNMELAVHIARRGWAEAKHIINTKSAKEISAWLKR